MGFLLRLQTIIGFIQEYSSRAYRFRMNLKKPTAGLKRIIYIFFMVLAIVPWNAVHADPADMYAQSQSITFNAAGLQIDWKIAPGPVLADTVWTAADQNHDNLIDSQE